MMKEVGPFKLVFSPDVRSPAQEEGQQGLAGALVWADVEGLTDFIDPSPTPLGYLGWTKKNGGVGGWRDLGYLVRSI